MSKKVLTLEGFLNKHLDLASTQDYEGKLSLLMDVRKDKDWSQWRMGAIADSLTLDFGSEIVEVVAREAGITKATLKRYRDIYRSYRDSPLPLMYPKLSHRHFLIVAPSENRGKLLKDADDGNWSSELLAVKRKQREGGEVKRRPKSLPICEKCNKWRVVKELVCQCQP